MPGRKKALYYDYAHTPDAVLSVKKIMWKNLYFIWMRWWRDIHKRSLMGKVHMKDFTIITDDNPEQDQIRKQIIETCPNAIEIASKNLAIKKHRVC